MKTALLIPHAMVAALAVLAAPAHAQTVWRCANNVYTNNAAEAKAKNCKAVEGGNVTIVEGTKVNGGGVKNTSAAPRAPSGPTDAQRISNEEQRARDADARAVLEAELKKAEARQAELLKEWNNGEPERQANEKNFVKYQERVAALKESIARNENDIAGIKRELSRFGAPAGK
jgi:hypothetical protein